MAIIDTASQRYGMKNLVQRLMKYKYVLLVILVGIVLLIWPFDGGDDEENQSQNTDVIGMEYSVEQLEGKLAETLSKISGAGEVEVILTLKSSTEKVLAQDTDTAYENAEDGSSDMSGTITTVTVSSGSGYQSTVVTKYIYPEFLGALVVCEGAGSSSVKLAVTEAVSSLTGLGADKITVVKMQKTS